MQKQKRFFRASVLLAPILGLSLVACLHSKLFQHTSSLRTVTVTQVTTKPVLLTPTTSARSNRTPQVHRKYLCKQNKKKYNMSNQQLLAGGPAVTINFTGQQPPSGTSSPSAFNSINVWLNGVEVIPDTSLATLPVTVNGLTITARTISNGAGIGSITAQLASSTSLANATGYVFNGYNNATQSTAIVDVGSANASTVPQNLTSMLVY